MTRLPPLPDELAKKADMYLRFDEVDRQFAAVGVRFDALEQRFDGLERRFERLEDRFDHLDRGMHQMFELMVKQGKTAMVTTVSAMTALTAIYGGMLIAFVA